MRPSANYAYIDFLIAVNEPFGSNVSFTRVFYSSEGSEGRDLYWPSTVSCDGIGAADGQLRLMYSTAAERALSALIGRSDEHFYQVAVSEMTR